MHLCFKQWFSQTTSQFNVKNQVGIQLLSPAFSSQLFGSHGHGHPSGKKSNDFIRDLNQMDATLKLKKSSLAKLHLINHELWGKNSADLPDLNFKLPCLAGSNNGKNSSCIATHFQILGMEQEQVFLPQALAMVGCQKIPTKPEFWQEFEGWTRYNPDGSFDRIEYPPVGEALVFDVEVMYQVSPFPIIATAVSSLAWYSWVTPGFFKSRSHNFIPRDLIPFGFPNTPRLVIGHFVSYDRARIKEEYLLKASKIGFIDTLSLHCAVGGLSNQQRALWTSYQAEKTKTQSEAADIQDSTIFSDSQKDAIAFFQEEAARDVAAYTPWEEVGSPNSLSSTAQLHLGIEMDKSVRKEFSAKDFNGIKDKFQEIMNYCSSDVEITFKLYQVLFPKFKAKCPHPVSFSGMMHMSKGILTTGDNWTEYIKKSEEKCLEFRGEIEAHLETLVNDALALMDSKAYLNDPWLKHLDWTVKPQKMTKQVVTKKGGVTPSRPYASSNKQLVGKPQWYRDLWDTKLKKIRLSTGKKVVPYLLRLEWSGHPLMHFKKFGWMFHHGKKDVIKPGSTSTRIESIDPFMEEGREYFRLPHATGEGKNVGNPLSKPFISAFESGVLTSSFPLAQKLLSLNSLCIYWISARARIKSQFVVWDEKGDLTGCKSGKIGIIVPQTAAMGTITRRATDATWMTASNAKTSRVGSELKAQIIAPKGYKFVGADVDSEELWIASLIGDSIFGIHGASAIGFMTLQGTKLLGTDLHSTSGRIVGISRNIAKIFNYSRIYGAGQNYASRLLAQHNPSMDKAVAQRKASELYNQTKGMRYRDEFKTFGCDTFWFGGSESFMFNHLEMIADSIDSRTPVLGCQIPDTLLSRYVNHNFKTSRINWVVQSSGVDYLHLLLVSMDYLIRRMGINGRFLLSIHDEVRFLVQEKDVAKAALALQISNLWTRCLFATKLGIKNLPLNIAFFSAIDIDHVMRKEVDMDCVTPSNSYPIFPGESQDIYQVVGSFGKELLDDSIYGPELTSVKNLEDVVLVDELDHSKSPVLGMDPVKQLLFIRAQMCTSQSAVRKLLQDSARMKSNRKKSGTAMKLNTIEKNLIS